ncbi:MAG: hypothetical protein ACTSWU_02315 [Candidatus Thorarchaeota archaeon]
MVIFYGGAYVVRGRLGLKENPPRIQYEESEPEDDSSIVAYLPLSPEDMIILDSEDRFVVSDTQRINLSGLDTALMLLAEVYLLYRGSLSIDHPHLIMWDHSLSSILANATPNVKTLRFSGLDILGETIWYPDLLVGYSKPWNEHMDIPTKKSHRLWERCISKLYQSEDGVVNLEEFCSDAGLSRDKVKTQISILWEYDRYGIERKGMNPDSALIIREGNDLVLNENYLYSVEKMTRLFEYFCRKFFREKDPTVLIYRYIDEDGYAKSRFLSSEEISFLMAIGLRLTFENCWKKGISLVGVVKDSASTYYTRNYFGVMKYKSIFDFLPAKIPVTDRITLERLPFIDDGLEGPWATTEFDSVFMTLRMRKPFGADTAALQGVRGNVLVQPNLIMKSLVQFFLRREEALDPSMGHVIFVDRLVHPDKQPNKLTIIMGDRDLGTIEPYFFYDSSIRNHEQESLIYLLSVLTRNVFPEVIGYPDPLHHADKGAKSVLKMVEPMLFSSERLNRSNPLHRTLRQLRRGSL